MPKVLIVIAVLLAAFVAALFAVDRYAPHQAARMGIELERSRSGLVEKRVGIDGFEIAYLEGGQGKPLILIHGFGADKDNFTRVSSRLTQHYHVFIPDLPGFGDSSKPFDADYSIPSQVERVRAFAAAVGVDRAHFGGSSMGGWIITEYALAYPEATASLWLLGPAGTAAAFDSELTRLIEESGRNPLLAETADAYPDIVSFVMAKPPFFPGSVLTVLGERAAADHALHARIFEQLNDPANPSPLLDERLVGLQTPALVVWGDEDRALSYAAAEVYVQAMPNAERVIMPGIGHLPMIEDSGRAAEDYLAFRARLDSPQE